MTHLMTALELSALRTVDGKGMEKKNNRGIGRNITKNSAAYSHPPRLTSFRIYVLCSQTQHINPRAQIYT